MTDHNPETSPDAAHQFAAWAEAAFDALSHPMNPLPSTEDTTESETTE